MDLHLFFSARYRPSKLRSASSSTLRLWAIALRKFNEHLCREATIDDLTDENVASFAMWRRQAASAATVNRDLASLLAAWRYASRLGLVDRWPTVELEKEPKRIPVAWQRHEFNQLMATVKCLPGMVGDFQASDWWRALLLLLFDSGERVSAALDLQWENVDLPGRWVVFRAETRKGQSDDSLVRIAEDTAMAVDKLRRRRGVVFPWPLTRTYIWKRFGEILSLAGLPMDRTRKFHCVRRTVASHASLAGGDATEILRHASKRTTQFYLDPRIAKKPNAIDYLWRPE